MNDSRSPFLSDDLIRVALTRQPPAAVTDVLGHDLSRGLATTTQRRRQIIGWPWTPSLPGLPPTTARRRFRAVAIMATAALILTLSLVAIVLVGSRHRLPPPFGLAKPGLLAFDSGGDIFVSNADGSGRRQLTSGPAIDLLAHWSPDGTKLAYLSLIDPTVSANYATPREELVVIDPDGSHRTVVGTKVATGSAYDDPYHYGSGASWSPDSRQLVYSGPPDGTDRIFVTQADGTGSRMIGDEVVKGQDPIWSPDGTRIAFRGGANDNDRGIYLMNADGSDVHRLIALHASYSPLTWSPDGSAIAYVERPGPEGQVVWVVGVDDGIARPVSNSTDVNDAPAWSPDGSWLAYSTTPKPYLPDVRFVVVRPDGSGATLLKPPVASGPAWSPDGKKLVGTAYEGATTAFQHSIAIIDIADGTAVILSRETSGSSGEDVKGYASWQPLAN
jgi:Tol biopolymer transport system component